MKKATYTGLLLIYTLLATACVSRPTIATPLSGKWLITFSIAEMGEVKTLMQLDVYPDERLKGVSFDAYTQPKMDRVILGTWKAEFVHLLSKKFRNGSLVWIKEGHIINDSIRGTVVTPFNNFYIRARINKDTINGLLEDGNHSTIGTLTGTHNPSVNTVRNYAALNAEILRKTKEKIYDRSILDTKEWKRFEGEMNKISAVANDDAVYMTAFFYYKKNLPFTHFNLYHPIPINDSTYANSKSNFVHLTEKSKETMYMRIESFSGDSTEMDSAFNYICSHHYKNLIVDIRDNSGGATEAGMAFAKHLFRDTVYGGIFLTQKYFNERATPPMVSDYNLFSSFTAASFSLFIKGINEQKGISLKIVPFSPVYTGNLYLLINENTASTCEPIAYAIKQYKRGILVGRRTAGAMMTGEHFDIKDGFELTIPTAIYYTADGKKLDKNGVQPDIETKDDALTVTLKHIK